ncbi:MAG: ThiF family adenylyltransferase [Polyangiaceae bacterium]|nr:ThiF family adenylyltransferase [Polyangiaceae bacterium]
MKRVVFCGVGALGSHAAVLCRNLAAQLVFIDFDRVESKNLLSQAFVKPSLGKNKADALKAQLLNFFGIKAEAFGVRLGEDNVEVLLKQADLVVDCFDNVKSRTLLSRFATKNDTPLVHAGISGDGTFGLVRWDERFVADAEDTEGQATCEGGEHLPMLGFVASVLARTIQDFVVSGERRDAIVALTSATVTNATATVG